MTKQASVKEEYNLPEVQEVISKFNQEYESGNIESNNSAATEMAINPGRLSSFLKGTYTGDVVSTAEKVKSYLKIKQSRAELPNDELKVIKSLYNTRMTVNLLNLVRVQRTIGVVVANSGRGKTTAFQFYATENSSVIYIEVDSSYSSKTVLSEICKIIGLKGSGQVDKLMINVLSKLKGSNRLIIIDQAEYLNESTLDLLRSINDKAQCGLVFGGLPELLKIVKGRSSVQEQIYSRVGACVELEPFSNEDMKKIINSHLHTKTKSYKEFIQIAKGNGRRLRILIRECNRIANGAEVTSEIVKIAAEQLITDPN